jgi:hypothetical protein
VIALALSGGTAGAYTFNTSPDWNVQLDTNLAYTLGLRAQHMDNRIGNNPIQQNDEYKFPNQGSITSNRFDAASELTASYLQNYGLDVSVDAWKDFAYNGGAGTNPGSFAPGVPYYAISSAPGRRYGAYTNNFYNVGGELENAFVFGNFNAGDVPVEVKVGRFTEYWGNALFSSGASISYGQSPIDIIKAVDAPGTELKDLFLPRGQVSIHANVSQSLTFGFQYQFEWRPNQFPEGGTFMGAGDPFFIGPETFLGEYKRGSDNDPPNIDGNFGVEAVWTPDFLNGAVGLYFRQFDDVSAYTPFELTVSELPPTYHMSYARHIRLYGISLDRNIGTVSTSVEASIRQNTGLSASTDPVLNPTGNDGPRGNMLNVVANAIYGLTPTPLWATGIAIGEVEWTHVLSVTHDKEDYDAVGYACAEQGLGENDGCATQNQIGVHLVFDPQWLQVFPGVDIDAPISAAAGLWGYGQTLLLNSNGTTGGSISYSLGVHALLKQKWNINLSYSGFHAPTGQVDHTPLGQPYYNNGVGNYYYNDKGQVQLVLSTAF